MKNKIQAHDLNVKRSIGIDAQHCLAALSIFNPWVSELVGCSNESKVPEIIYTKFQGFWRGSWDFPILPSSWIYSK